MTIKLDGTSVDARIGAHQNPPTPPLGSPSSRIAPPTSSNLPLVKCISETGIIHARTLSTGGYRFFGRKHICPGSDLRSACVRIGCQESNQISLNICRNTVAVTVDGTILNNQTPISLSEGSHDCIVEGINFQLVVILPGRKA